MIYNDSNNDQKKTETLKKGSNNWVLEHKKQITVCCITDF